jgi:hypothetical protein
MPEQARSSQGVSPDAFGRVGQWRARLQIRNGDFAAVGDLESMYVFNAGGTMTESSNYDAAHTSEIRYETFDEAGKPVDGGGDASGRGVRLRF